MEDFSLDEMIKNLNEDLPEKKTPELIKNKIAFPDDQVKFLKDFNREEQEMKEFAKKVEPTSDDISKKPRTIDYPEFMIESYCEGLSDSKRLMYREMIKNLKKHTDYQDMSSFGRLPGEQTLPEMMPMYIRRIIGRDIFNIAGVQPIKDHTGLVFHTGSGVDNHIPYIHQTCVTPEAYQETFVADEFESRSLSPSIARLTEQAVKNHISRIESTILKNIYEGGKQISRNYDEAHDINNLTAVIFTQLREIAKQTNIPREDSHYYIIVNDNVLHALMSYANVVTHHKDIERSEGRLRYVGKLHNTDITIYHDYGKTEKSLNSGEYNMTVGVKGTEVETGYVFCPRAPAYFKGRTIDPHTFQPIVMIGSQWGGVRTSSDYNTTILFNRTIEEYRHDPEIKQMAKLIEIRKEEFELPDMSDFFDMFYQV
jgi:hypothetical protein